MVIEKFWEYMFQTVNAALNTLNTMYANTTMRPFFNLFIVIVATAVIIRYIIMPIIGGAFGGSDEVTAPEVKSKKASSDKAKKAGSDKAKNTKDKEKK